MTKELPTSGYEWMIWLQSKLPQLDSDPKQMKQYCRALFQLMVFGKFEGKDVLIKENKIQAQILDQYKISKCLEGIPLKYGIGKVIATNTQRAGYLDCMASIAKRNVSLSELLPDKCFDLAEVYEGTHDSLDLEASYQHEQFLKEAFLDFYEKTQFTMDSEEKHQFIALWMFWLCKNKPAEMGVDLQNISKTLQLAKCKTLEQFIQRAK